MAEFVDMRTEKERLYDEQSEAIRKRFEELLPFAPYPTRAMVVIGKEFGLGPACVRGRLIKMGAYSPRDKRGRPQRKTL